MKKIYIKMPIPEENCECYVNIKNHKSIIFDFENHKILFLSKHQIYQEYIFTREAKFLAGVNECKEIMDCK